MNSCDKHEMQDINFYNLNSVGMVLQDEPKKNFISVWSCQFSIKEKITM